jgi:hypothetical protein
VLCLLLRCPLKMLSKAAAVDNAATAAQVYAFTGRGGGGEGEERAAAHTRTCAPAAATALLTA